MLGDSRFFVKIVGSDYHNHLKNPLRFSLYKKKIFITFKSFRFLEKKIPTNFQSYQFS